MKKRAFHVSNYQVSKGLFRQQKEMYYGQIFDMEKERLAKRDLSCSFMLFKKSLTFLVNLLFQLTIPYFVAISLLLDMLA